MTQEKEFSFLQLMFAGGSAGLIAEIITLPVDTMKVRMQVFQNKYTSVSQAARLVLKEEGVRAFYQGCVPGLLRQISFASFRMGFYDMAMQSLAKKKGKDNINILDRIFWGMVTGGAAISIANPFDMMKVRFQSDISPNGQRRYANVRQAFSSIYKTEGVKGFYQSLPPNILRNSIINAAELATYTQCKAFLMRNNIFTTEGIPLYFTCSFFAGFCAVLCGSPFDVIKSRMMDGKLVNGKKVLYNSIFEAVGSLYKEKGMIGFYAGFTANVQRIVSWNVVMFMTREFIYSKMQHK